jgi:hypothetical protein
VIAAQRVTSLAADGQDLDAFAGSGELADHAPRIAQDRGIEATGEAAIRGRDDDEMGCVLAGTGKERRRVRHAFEIGGERAEHALHAQRIRPRRLGLLLRAPQPRRRHHFHGRGDLLRRPNAANPQPQFLERGHVVLTRFPRQQNRPFRRPRESGDPGALDSRFRGNDDTVQRGC